MTENDEKIKVLIVDDSTEVRNRLSGIVEEIDGAEVLGTAANGITALDIISKHKPDILLLDIIMPQLDGFGVLELLYEKGELPDTIVISALSDQNFIMRALNYGVKYYIAKPFDGEVIKKRITDVIEMRKGSQKFKCVSIRSEARQTSIDEKISSVFISIGIPAHIKGYHFLREAVKMVVACPDSINRITKELYPGIARKFQTSPSKVERAIRHAIEVAWTRGRIESINQLFGFKVYGKNDKPTNGEFIALIADKLIIDEMPRRNAE